MIDVDVARPPARITLDAYELAIVEARVEVAGDSQDARLERDAAHQTLTLVLQAARIGAGPARIVLGWNGPLADDLVGFYHAEANGRHYAFTQFEPAEARRALPLLRRAGVQGARLV